MKQKLLNNFKLRALMLVAILCAGFTSAWGAEEVYKTALFGSSYNSKGVSGYNSVSFTATNNSFTVTATNFNNNNNGWNYIKCGGKNGAYTGTITTAAAIDQAITKVAVTIDAITASNVTSIKLYTSTNNSSWTEAGSFDKSTGVKVVNLSSPTANLYYKIEFVCTKGSSNGLVTVSKVEYYYNAGGNPLCATPTFSVAAGTYTSTQSVELSTETEDATIYYTTDGTTPSSSNGTEYSSAITVSETQTIKAIAVKGGLDDSSVASATYTIIQHAGTSGDPYTVADAKAAIDASTGVTGVYVTGIVCEGGSSLSSGAMNYWISDDGTESNKFEIYRGKGISGADFSATSDVQVGDIVVVTGNLTKYSTTYEFSAGSQLVSLVRKPADPTFSPAAGLVVSGTQVALACLTDGATIYYTTDGSTPTTTSSVYSSAITVTENMTIKAIAVKNEVSSDVAEAAYTIALPVATPTFSPAAGTYSSAQNVTISTGTADATIYYSYDNENWTAYTAALNIDETKTVYAKAEKDGMVTSAVASAEFTIHIPSITFDVATPKNLTYEAQNYDVAFTSEYTSGTLAAVLCDSEGNPTTYDWFSAAIVGGAVRVTLTQNTDTENGRTAYFKVTADNATSAVFSVVQAKFVADYVTLPFAWEGGTSSALEAVTGVTASGLGDYAEGNAPYRVKMDGVGDYILIKTDGQPGVVSIGVKMIGGATTSKIKVQQSADGTNFTDVEELTISGSQNDVVNLATTNAFNSESRYVKIIKSVHASGGNIGVGPISITKASTEPAIVAESSVDLADSATSGEIAYSINHPNGNTLTATTTTDWISNVTVDSENSKVTFTTTANTGAERVGTITLSYTGAENKVITVTQAEKVVTLTYNPTTTITSGKHYIITDGSTTAMGGQYTNNRGAITVTKDGDDVTFLSTAGVAEFVIYGPDADGLYTIYDEKNEGYLYAASSSSNHLKTQTGIDDNARWEITFDDEEDFANIVAVNSDNRNVMQYNSGSTIFSCYGSASQSDVYLYEKDGEATPTESVTVGAAGYATYVSDNALDFSKSSINAYIAIADGTTGVTFSQITKVPANTGVLLYKDGGTTEDIPTLTGAKDATNGNVFLRGTGAAVASVDGNLHNYILNKPSEKPIGFYRAAGQTVAKNRAYIQIDESTPVKDFISLPWDDVTGVNSLTSSPSPMSEVSIFNLAGQKMSKLQKGVNIVNGKKVLVK